MEDFVACVDSKADPTKCKSSIERYGAHHDPEQKETKEHGPLGTFVFDGVIGKGFIAHVRVELET